MRKGILGSIAALTAGAGMALGQGGIPAPASVGPSMFGGVMPAAGSVPPPMIMPPLPGVPPGGPPTGPGMDGTPGGQPPVPMYPPPGPYNQPLFQSTPGPVSSVDGTGTAPHYWSSFEYLLYFPKHETLGIPLVTSSAPNDSGLVGRSSTTNLLGPGRLAFDPSSGFRVTAGFFGDQDRRYGAEASGFSFEQKSNIQSFQSGSGSTLAIPFVDSTGLVNSSLVVANPNYGTGAVTTYFSTQIYGVEGNGVLNLFRTRPDRDFQFSLDALGGYRYVQLTEVAQITSSSNVTSAASVLPQVATLADGTVVAFSPVIVTPTIIQNGAAVSVPGNVFIQDTFHVRNQFNGGQVGLRGFARYGMFTFTTTGKFAFGNNHETADITGVTGINSSVNGTSITTGGLFANASNSGHYTHDEYAFIPEVNGSVGVNLTRWATFNLGYNFLYINRVARPDTMISPVVNTAQIPISTNFGSSTTTPVFSPVFSQQQYFLHGLSFGFTYKF